MPNTKRHTILVAEELALVREGIARLCEANGCFHVAGHCSDGLAAIDMLQSVQPDVAVIDFNLPKLFSLELVRRIRESGAATKFLIMASKGDRKMALEALRSGADTALERDRARLELAGAHVDGADPARLLQRGWSITRTTTGSVVRDVAELAPGDLLSTTVASGTVESTVVRVAPDHPRTPNPEDS